MFLVPYIHKVLLENGLNIHTIEILTVGGKYLWEETNEQLDLEKDILNPNGIYMEHAFRLNDNKLIFCEVDVEKTNIADFYKWYEIGLTDQETFCWRTYTHISGSKNEEWLSVPVSEKLSRVALKNIIRAIVINTLQ